MCSAEPAAAVFLPLGWKQILCNGIKMQAGDVMCVLGMCSACGACSGLCSQADVPTTQCVPPWPGHQTCFDYVCLHMNLMRFCEPFA
jgi:hypothetical protein